MSLGTLGAGLGGDWETEGYPGRNWRHPPGCSSGRPQRPTSSRSWASSGGPGCCVQVWAAEGGRHPQSLGAQGSPCDTFLHLDGPASLRAQPQPLLAHACPGWEQGPPRMPWTPPALSPSESRALGDGAGPSPQEPGPSAPSPLPPRAPPARSLWRRKAQPLALGACLLCWGCGGVGRTGCSLGRAGCWSSKPYGPLLHSWAGCLSANKGQA